MRGSQAPLRSIAVQLFKRSPGANESLTPLVLLLEMEMKKEGNWELTGSCLASKKNLPGQALVLRRDWRMALHQNHPVRREIKVEVYVCGQPGSLIHGRMQAGAPRAGLFPGQSILQFEQLCSSRSLTALIIH